MNLPLYFIMKILQTRSKNCSFKLKKKTLSHNRIYINFRPLVVIFDGVSALISTE